MKAAFLDQVAGPESLTIGEIRTPSPGPGEVLVKVHATAATPTEFKWFPTFRRQSGETRDFPVVPSHEFSGVVSALGDGVTDFQIGDAVYGMNDWFANGALAEFCVAPATAIALKPASLDHSQAASVPISALTAWQGLFDHGGLQAGQRVLIHGASGGVGVFAVQFAQRRGARIVATGSTRHLDFVRGLGADEVIDYRTQQFETIIRDVDLVFDTVGGETLARSWSVIKPGGRIVTIAAQSETETDERVRKAFFIVEPNRGQLAEIAALFDAGKIQSFVEAVLPLAEARAAYARAERGGMRGKIVLEIAP